jgi:hypothetical protein
MKEGMVKVAYKSNLTFYTLADVTFGDRNRMTRHHMGAIPCNTMPQLSNSPIYRIIIDLPLDKNSVHDIRLKFHVPNIYNAILSYAANNEIYDHDINPTSKDISLSVWDFENLDIKVIIHNTDTVNVFVGCSYYPIAVDIAGIIRLTNALAVVRERLLRLFTECARNSNSIEIPPHADWVVTMWHFGADASVEYTGERFSATWGIAQDAIIRVYSKTMRDNRTRIRLERQEYPKTTLALALEQKINHKLNRWSGGE